MTITEVLKSEKTDAAKLTDIHRIVESLRSDYGNAETAIPMPEVTTSNGLVDFCVLEDDSKVELVANEVRSIKIEAIEAGKHIPGLNIEKRALELIVTSPILTNLCADSGLGIL